MMKSKIVIFISIILVLSSVIMIDAKTKEETYQEKLAQLKPDDVNGQYQLGLWCEQNKLSVQAKTQFESVITLDPNHSGARQKLGFIKYKDKWIKPEEKVKIEYQEKSVQLKDNDVKGHYELGLWCKKKGLPDEAKSEFEKVIKSDPNHKAAREELEEMNSVGATIWFLYHSSFAVKTQKHFIIFDYANNKQAGSGKGLSAGVIDPAEIKTENVLVFVSHEHPDHFNPIIASWQKTVSKIKYIVSTQVVDADPRFKSDVEPNLVVLDHTQTKEIEGVKVSTFPTTDSGVGFLLEFDGLVILHPGDLAAWSQNSEETYKKNIEQLKALDLNIDIAFLPLAANGQKITRENAVWTVKELSPKIVIPMHLFEAYKEGELFVKIVTEQKLNTQAVSVKKRGQSFSYRNGRLKER